MWCIFNPKLSLATASLLLFTHHNSPFVFAHYISWESQKTATFWPEKQTAEHLNEDTESLNAKIINQTLREANNEFLCSVEATPAPVFQNMMLIKVGAAPSILAPSPRWKFVLWSGPAKRLLFSWSRSGALVVKTKKTGSKFGTGTALMQKGQKRESLYLCHMSPIIQSSKSVTPPAHWDSKQVWFKFPLDWNDVAYICVSFRKIWLELRRNTCDLFYLYLPTVIHRCAFLHHLSSPVVLFFLLQAAPEAVQTQPGLHPVNQLCAKLLEGRAPPGARDLHLTGAALQSGGARLSSPRVSVCL